MSPTGECPVGGSCAHGCPPAECYRERTQGSSRPVPAPRPTPRKDT